MKRIFTPIMASALLIATSATSCSLYQKITNPSTPTTPTDVETKTIPQTEKAIHSLLTGSWTVTAIGDQKVSDLNQAYIEFAAEPTNEFIVKAYAYDGCNYLNGAYAITPGGQMHRASEFISTMRMCDGATDVIGFANAINFVDSYKITSSDSGLQLTMFGADGKALMQLVRLSTDVLNGSWNVVSIEGTSVSADLGLSLTFNMAAGTVSGNAGCNTLSGKYLTSDKTPGAISFTNLSTTRMSCPYLETEQNFLRALRNVTGVRPGTEQSQVVLTTDAGTEAVVLSRQ